jgi:hypothetical protein
MLLSKIIKSLCFVCGVGFLCDGAYAMLKVNGVDVDLGIVDAMLNPGEPQIREFNRYGKMFVEESNKLGSTIYPYENNTDKYCRVNYYESNNVFEGHKAVMRRDTIAVFLKVGGNHLHFVSELCEVFLRAALEFSVKLEDIVQTETDPWEIALLNITDCPEGVLIPMCMGIPKYLGECLGEYLTDAMREKCKKFEINFDRLENLAKANASSMPNGDALLLHQRDRSYVEDAVFSISVSQYRWAQKLLEANKDVFNNLNDKK